MICQHLEYKGKYNIKNLWISVGFDLFSRVQLDMVCWDKLPVSINPGQCLIVLFISIARFHTPAVLPNHKPAAYSCSGSRQMLPLCFPNDTVPALPRWNGGCRASTVRTVYGCPAVRWSVGTGCTGCRRIFCRTGPIAGAGCSWKSSGRNPWASGSTVHRSSQRTRE